MSRDFELSKHMSFRASREVKSRVKAVIRDEYPKYENMAHFVRVAVFKLLREEEAKENA